MAYEGMFNPGSIQGYGSPQNFGYSGQTPESAGWNLNSSYMTPSIMAGYRPAYSGDQNFPMPYMGFGRGAAVGLPTPFQPETPFYMNPLQYRDQGLQSMGNSSMDAGMTVMQMGGSVAIGLAVSGAVTSNALRMPVNKSWGTFKSAFGGSRSGSVFEAVGGSAGRSLGGLGGAVGRGVGGFLGAGAGMAFAELGLPLAAAEVANQTIFAPYTAMRRGEDSFREAYRGYAGIGTGRNPLGVNSRMATDVGTELAKQFSSDLGFKPGAGADIFQYSQQAGLYKGSQISTGGIKEKTKQIAEQMKMVMDVFNEPSMQDAIQTLGRMSLVGGAGAGGISRLGSAYRIASAMTGEASQKLMNTVGAQGQMMYGQAGLTPYLGQLAGLNAYTAMSYAQKNGLVSNQALAMMGGLEGASQSMVQVQAGLAQTPYNRMGAMLQEFYKGGRGKGGINDTLGEYGQISAVNPIIAAGQMAMYGDRAVSAQMSKNPLSMMTQMIQEMKLTPGATTPDGKVRFEAIAAAMSARGFDSNAINSLAANLSTVKDQGYVGGMRVAAQASFIEQRASRLEREGLNYNGIFHYEHGVKSAAAYVQTGASQMWGDVRNAGHLVGDSISQAILPNTIQEKNTEYNLIDQARFSGAAANAAWQSSSGVIGGTLDAIGALGTGILQTGMAGLTSELNNLNKKLSSNPKDLKEFQSLLAKSKKGKLSHTDNVRLMALTGAPSPAKAKEIALLHEGYVKIGKTGSSISSKGMTRLSISNRAKSDLLEEATAEDEASSWFGLFGSNKASMVQKMSSEDIKAIGNFSVATAGETSSEKRLAMLETDEYSAARKAILKSTGKTSSGEITEEDLRLYDIANSSSKSMYALSGMSGKSDADARASYDKTGGMLDLVFNSTSAKQSYDSARVGLSDVNAGGSALSAREESAKSAEEVELPEKGVGDFTENLSGASLELGGFRKAVIEATSALSNSYGYRSPTAALGAPKE